MTTALVSQGIRSRGESRMCCRRPALHNERWPFASPRLNRPSFASAPRRPYRLVGGSVPTPRPFVGDRRTSRRLDLQEADERRAIFLDRHDVDHVQLAALPRPDRLAPLDQHGVMRFAGFAAVDLEQPERYIPTSILGPAGRGDPIAWAKPRRRRL
jgi:hypothetical protein